MNEENDNLTERNENDWQPPPIPEEIIKEREEPRMSEVATLGNIFIEPGNTFEDLRRKPRFLLAGLILCLLTLAFSITFQQRMGAERFDSFYAEQVDKNPQSASLTPEQKQNSVKIAKTFGKAVTYGLPVILIIVFLLGALFYWLGVKAMGGSMSYLQGLSVWIYSSFPPGVIFSIANFLVLFLKSPDEIDIATSQRGLAQANPAVFLDGKTMPVLATVLGAFDVFFIWGLILAAIGLHKCGKISKGAAWGIVLILALLGITLRVVGAVFSGNPS